MTTVVPGWGIGTAIIALVASYAIETVLTLGTIYFSWMRRRSHFFSHYAFSKYFIDYRRIYPNAVGTLYMISYMCTILLIFLLVTAWHKQPFLEAMRFVLPRWYWMGGAIILGTFYAVLSNIVNLIQGKTTGLDKSVTGLSGVAPTVIWALSVVLLVPLTEELIYRGLFFPALAHGLGVWLSIGITAMIFSLSHFTDYGLQIRPYIWLLVLGLVLTWLRAYSDSILPSIFMHMVTNGLSFFFLVRRKPQRRPF